MTERLASLAEIADRFDALVLDQWGVLHNGTVAYPGAIDCLRKLKSAGRRLAVLSNSGKRAEPNMERIAAMGFERSLFDVVMTSGEALWLDISRGLVREKAFFPIERAKRDAANWSRGLNISLTDTLDDADALLLMGLPDGAAEQDFDALLQAAHFAGLPMICTNPDRASPRADDKIVVSPGALAQSFFDQGGKVRSYGKPHLPIFRTLETVLNARPDRLLMVGDSLEHDIAGGHNAGWSTAFVEGGLHASRFASENPMASLSTLVAENAAPQPDFTLARLQ